MFLLGVDNLTFFLGGGGGGGGCFEKIYPARAVVQTKFVHTTTVEKKISCKALPDGLTYATSEKNIMHTHAARKNLLRMKGFGKKTRAYTKSPTHPQKLNGPPLRQ